jgi:hypothetical protein
VSFLKAIGIAFALASGALHLATYRPHALRIAVAGLLAAPALVMMPIIGAITGSLVNPMAAVWGSHTAWKIVLAGALHVGYPITAFSIGFLAIRKINRDPTRHSLALPRTRTNSPSHRWSDCKRALGFAALPILFFVANSVFILVESLTTPAKSYGNLVILAQVPGFEWVLEHPTLAIHHTYAATAYFYSGALAALFLIASSSVSKRLLVLIQREDLAKGVSAVLVVGGLALAIFG